LSGFTGVLGWRLGRDRRPVAPKLTLPCGAEPSGLTSWDRQILYDKLGIGPTDLSTLRRSVEERRCKERRGFGMKEVVE
jgi:hypothetical protein